MPARAPEIRSTRHTAHGHPRARSAAAPRTWSTRGGLGTLTCAESEMNGEPLTHLGADGRARMVDVGSKPVTARVAVARATVRMESATAAAVVAGDAPKGDVLATARLAAIQAAKRTDEWIPLAHTLPLEAIHVDIAVDPAEGLVSVTATARATARTGVEMEAMVAASAGALCIYDMVKAVERGVVIERVELIHKSGGRSGTWNRP